MQSQLVYFYEIFGSVVTTCLGMVDEFIPHFVYSVVTTLLYLHVHLMAVAGFTVRIAWFVSSKISR